jgi:hypothetical protein
MAAFGRGRAERLPERTLAVLVRNLEVIREEP